MNRSLQRILTMAEKIHLYRALQELYLQKQKLERVISSLEELRISGNTMTGIHAAVKRRGRKAMGIEERQEVSRRMKRYWASRRKRTPKAHSSVRRNTIRRLRP
jgi:hypothetical protein